MSTYLGNPSLSTAVKDRVSTTFQQTLALYKQGRVDEVVAGCNLMLQMDPMFDPAKKLLEKTRNPALPINVDALVPESADDALAEARRAMAARDFQRVVAITTEVLTNDLMNDGARILGDEAREKMEAAPFVEQFAAKCEQQLAAGNLSAARGLLDKARALDAEHPAIVRMSGAIAQRESGPKAAPSFVVDNPPPPPSPHGRGTAQASDFGFTFEEEKPPAPPPSGGGGFSFDAPSSPAAPQPPQQPASGGFGSFSFDSPSPAASKDAPFAGFSFDAPPAAAPAPPQGAHEFDFSAASVETSPDDQRKIQQYLADGDRAFQAANYQEAIDLWSRIFLIDVTNEQASERIESAKAKRRDIESKVESMMASAIAAFDRNDRDGARAKFAEVLRVDPKNSTALDYMDRLADSVTEGGAGAFETPYVAPEAEKFDIFADDVVGSTEVLMPPDPVPAATTAGTPAAKKTTAAAKAKVTAPRRATSIPMGPILTVLGVIVLAGAGWFAWTKFMTKPAYDPGATQAIFGKAAVLAKQGKYDQAISVLQDIKPEDPQHDRALLQISDLQRKKTQSAEMIDGRPAAVVYQESLVNGKTAFEAHDYDVAKKDFETAMRVKPLPPDMKTLYDTASEQVAKLDSAKALFGERRYADALASLQPLLAADPQNKNIQRLIKDAHFNLGAVALQEDHLPDAIREFDEVLKVDPTDDLARRSKELAQRYEGQGKDLLYKIYVKYLPMRAAG